MGVGPLFIYYFPFVKPTMANEQRETAFTNENDPLKMNKIATRNEYEKKTIKSHLYTNHAIFCMIPILLVGRTQVWIFGHSMTNIYMFVAFLSAPIRMNKNNCNAIISRRNAERKKNWLHRHKRTLTPSILLCARFLFGFAWNFNNGCTHRTQNTIYESRE